MLFAQQLQVALQVFQNPSNLLHQGRRATIYAQVTLRKTFLEIVDLDQAQRAIFLFQQLVRRCRYYAWQGLGRFHSYPYLYIVSRLHLFRIQ